MAKGRKTGGRDIKKGQILNPKGAGAWPPEVKAIRKLSAIEYVKTMNKFFHMTLEELEIAKKDKTTNAIEHFVISTLIKCIMKGDPARMEFLLNRAIGKVKDSVDVSSSQPFLLNYKLDD